MKKSLIVQVQGISINVMKIDQEEYISLTDMIRVKDGDFFISDWLRNRNTIEFLGIREEVNNPDFNYGGFATIKGNEFETLMFLSHPGEKWRKVADGL